MQSVEPPKSFVLNKRAQSFYCHMCWLRINDYWVILLSLSIIAWCDCHAKTWEIPYISCHMVQIKLEHCSFIHNLHITSLKRWQFIDQCLLFTFFPFLCWNTQSIYCQNNYLLQIYATNKWFAMNWSVIGYFLPFYMLYRHVQ